MGLIKFIANKVFVSQYFLFVAKKAMSSSSPPTCLDFFYYHGVSSFCGFVFVTIV